MTNRELLREIYKESKAINRNIQRVANAVSYTHLTLPTNSRV